MHSYTQRKHCDFALELSEWEDQGLKARCLTPCPEFSKESERRESGMRRVPDVSPWHTFFQMWSIHAWSSRCSCEAPDVTRGLNERGCESILEPVNSYPDLKCKVGIRINLYLMYDHSQSSGQRRASVWCWSQGGRSQSLWWAQHGHFTTPRKILQKQIRTISVAVETQSCYNATRTKSAVSLTLCIHGSNWHQKITLRGKSWFTSIKSSTPSGLL